MLSNQATTTAHGRVAHPVAERTIDGGYSGDVTVTRGEARADGNFPDLIFVTAELLQCDLVLFAPEARRLAAALLEVAEAGA